MDAQGVLLASVESTGEMVLAIRAFLVERSLTTKEFCEKSGMPANTLYKIMSRKREDFMISNLRRLIWAMRKIDEANGEDRIAVITARGALDTLRREVTVEGKPKPILIREYPAMTIEEEIIQGIRAEREKMKGIVCGPIAANTLEKVVRIPVTALQFEEEAHLKAISKLARKI